MPVMVLTFLQGIFPRSIAKSPLKDAHRTSQQALFPNIGSPKIGMFFMAISISVRSKILEKTPPILKIGLFPNFKNIRLRLNRPFGPVTPERFYFFSKSP